MIWQLDPVSDLELVMFKLLDTHGHKLLEHAGNYASFQQFSVSLRLDFSTENCKNENNFFDPGRLGTSTSETAL